MRPLVAGLLSAGLLVAVPDLASARHARHVHSHSSIYPGATPRQLRNLRGYERGEYYEQLIEAVPFGSRAWWEIKGRQGT
jgi:hypothetical protein